MANETNKRDSNRITTIAGVTDDASLDITQLRLDPTTKRLKVNSTISGSVAVQVTSSISGIGDGVTVVTTAGTDVALAESTDCKRVTIQAQTDNTSFVAVGATGVDATEVTGTGILLGPGDAYELDIDNLADIYIDSLVNGEGVRYTYYT